MSAVDELERGRSLYDAGAWAEAHASLASADAALALDPEGLERLATAAYMLGRLEAFVDAMTRAHQAHLDAAAPLRAARCAFWTGMQLLLAGEAGRGSGWIGRAQRLVEEAGVDCAERGYLQLAGAFRCQVAGDYEAGAAIAADAATAGRRFGDADLYALAVHGQGTMLVHAGSIAEGLALLDEAMVSVTAGELSPVAMGIVYCGVILACRAAHEPRRAQEWTTALARWCERQPDLVAFTGRCRVHRAEIMQLAGAWTAALDEARCAEERAGLGNHRSALAEAAYLQGEVHRLRGAFREAEDAYRKAAEHGREPQPGLALLRLAEGDRRAALAAVRRMLAETADRSGRMKLLPAAAEIMLAAGDVDGARDAADELDAAARAHEAGMLRTIAAQTRGAVDLAAGEPERALASLRRAWHVWEEMDAPYEAARTRVLLARACEALGDREGAAFELDAARRAFAELGALPELERLGGAEDAREGLTERELEVLALVAEGRTNREIAARLVISERTVDRHVANLLAKLRVPTRAAATAYAYEHRLL